jgi:hypothetical protein
MQGRTDSYFIRRVFFSVGRIVTSNDVREGVIGRYLWVIYFPVFPWRPVRRIPNIFFPFASTACMVPLAIFFLPHNGKTCISNVVTVTCCGLRKNWHGFVFWKGAEKETVSGQYRMTRMMPTFVGSFLCLA